MAIETKEVKNEKEEEYRKYPHKHPIGESKQETLQIDGIQVSKGKELRGIETENPTVKDISPISSQLGIDIFKVKAKTGNNPNKYNPNKKQEEDRGHGE